MTGATENYKHRGLIPRTISQVFKEISQLTQMAIQVRVSYLEIYNENMVDLLNPLANTKEEANGLTVLDEKNGNIVAIVFLTYLYAQDLSP